MTDSFIFYRSFMEAIDDVEPETYKRLIQAITHYAMDGIMPEGLNGLEQGIFISWKANVDSANKKRENGKKGAEYGALGGRPKKNNPIGVIKKPHRGYDETPNRNVNRNDNDNENVNVNENVNENEKKVLSFSNENDCQTQSVQRVIESWNLLSDFGVKTVNMIRPDSTRYRSLCKRIKDYGEEKVIEAIERIRGSDFLLGRKTDFLITFDWFVKPNNFAKVADGNYDNKSSPDSREAFFEKWRNV